MEFAGLGTLINVIAILVGSSIGIIAGHRLQENTRSLVTDVLGLVTLLGAAGVLIPLWSDSFTHCLPRGSSLLLILATLLIGGIIGAWLRLEDRLESLGHSLRSRFNASDQSPFVEGFVSASLLFVIGPLAILGSISDGMGTGIDQLLLKSALDFFAAMAFSSTLGWGVAVSALPVALYQGGWTVIGALLGNVMAPYQVDAMTITGGVILVGIGLRLLKIRSIAVGNLLPAIFLAPMLALLLHQLI